MPPQSKLFLPPIALALLTALGCSSSGGDGERTLCLDGKCDDPGSTANAFCTQKCEGSEDESCFKDCRDEAALNHCKARRSDAIDSAQRAFVPDAIRWACADVDGVNTNNQDDRGQEYCEYYALIQPPPAAEGSNLLPEAVTLGRSQGSGRPTTPLSIELTEDQIFQLEDNPDAVVGACVFTSWHSDIQERLPVCDAPEGCPELTAADGAVMPPWSGGPGLGITLEDNFMRMKGSINSNNAAADLFEKCLTEPPAGDPANPEDPLHDEYLRGCWKSYELFGTEWRRSDPSVCAAGVRLAECGCGVDTDGDGVADVTGAQAISRAVVPFQPDEDGTLRLRGFHLGTWSGQNELPAGCRYVETGDADSTRTLVACDLLGSDLLGSQNDPKGFCRAKYGDNVVVHVPVPGGALVCSPPEGQYSDCSDMPWVVGADAEPDADTSADPDAECKAVAKQAWNGADDQHPKRSGNELGDCACIDTVCAVDSFCCENTWDSVCADAAAGVNECN
jgi:hypothetical protein